MGIIFKNVLGRDKHKNDYSSDIEVNSEILCDNLNFTAAETYKMLRTKIILSIPDTKTDSSEKRGKVIGITSSISGEGKSTTAVNLAYTMAETGSKVCIIEADMRRPNISARLNLGVTRGLSNILAGQCGVNDAFYSYVSEKNVKFSVIPGGDPSPASSELLSSVNMKKLIDVFSKTFDFVIVDLPPVGIVTDALIVAELVDGMLFVVRQGYTQRQDAQYALGQFDFSKTRILGIVMTSGEKESEKSGYGRYGRYGKYQKYGAKYYGKGSYSGSRNGSDAE